MTRFPVGVAISVMAGLVLLPPGHAAAQDECGDPPVMPPLTFAEPQVIDDVRAGGEPSVEGLPNGTLLYAAHASTTLFKRDNMPDADYVTPYTGATYLWRSTDGGASWRYVGLAGTEAGPHATVSGFSDPDFAVDAAGNVYTSGINLANVYVAKSEDSGATWTGHPFGTLATDREWLAADQEDVVYLNGNHVVDGRQLWKSTDGGLTFDLANPVDLPGSGPPSKIEVDQSDGRLYFPDGIGGVAVFPSIRNDDVSRIDADVPGGTPHDHGFLNNMAIDDAGNVYLVANTRTEILVSHSTDRGETWTTDAIHDTAADDTPEVAEEVLWPWISAGADGRVGVSWYQADKRVTDTEGTSAAYRVYAAQTATGHGWTDLCGIAHEPVYEVAVATPEPFHTGTICSSGTICQVGGIDRRLGDYHTNSITADGAFVIAYSDTSRKPDGAISHPGFVKQAGGVNFTDVVSTPPEPPQPPEPPLDLPDGDVDLNVPVDPLPPVADELCSTLGEAVCGSPDDDGEPPVDSALGGTPASQEQAAEQRQGPRVEPQPDWAEFASSGTESSTSTSKPAYDAPTGFAASPFYPDTTTPEADTPRARDDASTYSLESTRSALGRDEVFALAARSGLFTALGLVVLMVVAFRQGRARRRSRAGS